MAYRSAAGRSAAETIEGFWAGGEFAGRVGRSWAEPTAAERILADPEQRIFAIVDVEVPGSADESLGLEVLAALRARPAPSPLGSLASRVLGAGAAVERRPPATRGAATLAVLELTAGWASVARLGDSAAFLARDGRLQRVTEDDDLVRAARLDPIAAEAASTGMHRTAVLSALDGTPRRSLDPVHVRARAGDRWLLISDGVTRFAPSSPLAAAMTEPDLTLAERCQRIVDLRGREVHGDAVVLIVDLERAPD